MDANDAPARGNTGLVSRTLILVRGGAWLLSAALLGFVAACYWWRFDTCTVVTLFPTWCWTAIGLWLAWLAVSRRRWVPSAILLAGWLAFLSVLSDSPLSIVRACLPRPERGTSIRVVALNCAASADAAHNVCRYSPDVVLLQESASADTLAALATELFGSSANLVRGVDAAILARGQVTPVYVPPDMRGNFVHARVELNDTTINVISLRLWPCPVRFDLWSPACWQYFEQNRQTRRRQLAKIADYLKTLPRDEPIVLGGDFNCPPGDAVVRLLQPRLTDAFTVAGRGWGATIIELAGWPLIRIDQIWISSQLRATSVVAERADPSDHHMVVADFSLEDRQK